MKFVKTSEVEIEITPKDVAQMFCSMSSADQAEFFNAIHDEVSTWPGPFVMQLQYIHDSPFLKQTGKDIMSAIGEYSK